MPLVNWSILAAIFGMQVDSLITFNIIQLVLSMGLFYFLAKPNIKQSLFIITMYIVFLPITYYAFTMLPEISCYAYIIVFLGLFVNLRNTSRFRKIKLGILFAIPILLTWMRPFYLILLLLPGHELLKICRKKSVGIITCVVLFVCAGAGYLWIYDNMCAPYFSDLLKFSIMENIVSAPIKTVKELLLLFFTIFQAISSICAGGGYWERPLRVLPAQGFWQY